MIKKFCKAFLAVLCIALASTYVTAYASTVQQELDDAKQQEKDLQERLKAVQASIEQIKTDISTTQEFIQRLDEQMTSLTDDIIATNDKIDKKNEEISITTSNLEEAEDREKEQYESMKLRIKYMYENSSESYIDLLLSASSISELLNRAEYVTKVNKYDRDKLDEYIEVKETIDKYKSQLEAEEEELEEYKADLENQQEGVQLLLDAKTEQMQKLQSDKDAYVLTKEEIDKDLEDLDKNIALLTAQYNAEQLAKANAVASQSALYSNSLLIWPCPGNYTITSNFSTNRLDPVTESYYAAHKGTDIAAVTGTPVVAAAAGLVTAAGYSSSMGNYVVIAHGDGITTRYYHNSSLAVSAGQSVAGGQVISYVGSTGQVTGPHLHFEVRINDVAVDAMQFFSY
jgi:murein DD-endopeptidase MepM/ murein hydrolase activator NlpD